MKILLSWLNEYGDFGDPTNADDVQRVADALTSLGLEVDSVTTVGETVPGVVTPGATQMRGARVGSSHSANLRQ